LNIETIIQQTIFNYQLSAHQKTLFLLAKIQPNISLVQGNGDLLTQVIVNLIGNSLKFTYPNGKILLRAYRVDYLTRFKIRIELLDTGIGIDQAFKNIIFNRFVKQENDVYNLNGTGLGLAIVKSILKEHQSSIRVITRQNIGSVFWFDLNIFI
jgi:signal transduction histidine kinase